LGAHLDIAPHSDLIASLIYQNEEDQRTFQLFSQRDDIDGYIGEAQYVFRLPRLDFVIGGGHFTANTTTETTFQSGSKLIEESNIGHTNGYIYSHIRFPTQFTWTLGVSIDSLSDESLGGAFNRLNPKFGMIWTPTISTTLRLAAFKTLKRSLLTDQTIEPTQVAGFNQFFDEFGGAEATRYGIGLDHKLSPNLYGGLEASKRDINTPRIFSTGTVGKDLQEVLYRAYLNWTPKPGLAASLGYQLEDFDTKVLGSGTIDTRTHLLPVSLRYFHPSGLFGSLCTTYVKQRADLLGEEQVGNEFVFVENPTTDEFVLLDAIVGYRLPKRFGIFSIEVRNLLDQDFNFQGIGLRTNREEESPPFLPERTILAQIILAF